MHPDILERIIAARKKSELLSDWDKGYLESLETQFNKRGRLSPRQIEIFARIEEEKLSTEAQDERQKWNDNYDAEKRRVAKVCANYYLDAGYFTSLATRIVEEPEFIPSEKAWKKMCENKYAKKVLANHDNPSKYEIGSLVAFRATADWAHRMLAGDKPCVVISSGGFIKSAAKGAKPYKVLPYGLAKPIECEERHLKAYKKSKKNKKVVDKSIPF
tara:strand:+ start:123 stop:770 length:648 start_codon:yes stop_codon:yes gene_type:complete